MKIIKASIAIGASFLFLAGCVADTTSPADVEHAASSAQALEMTTFPPALEDEHMNWHMHAGDPSMGGRAHLPGQPGSGTEFFDFHHAFMQQALAWYATTAFSPSLVTPWTEIPAVLKDAQYGWTASLAAAEQRIITNSPAFASDDDFGIFVESTIHNWIHGAAAQAFNEPVLGTFSSPRSTYFYQIHGLVDAWRQAHCFPKTTCSAGQCGAIPNGCGGMLSCGGCEAGETCSANSCVCTRQRCFGRSKWNPETCECEIACNSPRTCCIAAGGYWDGKYCE